MNRTLLQKCLEDYPEYFLKLCRIGIEHPHLAPRVLSLLEKMATMTEDMADLDALLKVRKAKMGGQSNVPTR